MKKTIKLFPLVSLLFSVLFLVSCGTNNTDLGSSPNPEETNTPQTENSDKLNWSVVVSDSSTIQIGNVESTTYLDFTATNDVKGIKGHYTGSGSGKTINSNSAYGSNSQAGVENSLTISFTISDPLAPLVSPDDEDDNNSLAPLVPNDDDALAPLTDSSQEADYEGAGTITIAPRTAQVQGMGVGATKQLDGQTFPINIFVYGEKVRIELKTPQGSVFFDGNLSGK